MMTAIIGGLISITILIFGISNIYQSSLSSEDISITHKSKNILLSNYYVGSIEYNVYVLKFSENNILEIVDCGLGRSKDKRTKKYGTYKINDSVVTITLNSSDILECIIHEDGSSIIIENKDFTKTDPQKLDESTLKCFD